MRGTSRATTGGRHAQPKRRAEGTAALLPALTSSLTGSLSHLRVGESGPAGRRRAQRAGSAAGGSHRAPRRAASRDPAGLLAEGSVPWARTVAFSGVTGVAALTVGFTVLADTDSASGFAPQARPQETAAVTQIERAATPQSLPVARRSAPAEYVGKHVARPADGTAPDAVVDAPSPAPAAAPSARPSAAPTPAAPETPDAPRPPAPTDERTPAPEESPTPGLLEGLTGTLDDTVTGVVGVLPDLG